MTIEQAKQAIKVCPEHYCTSCPVEEIPYECTCDDVVTILKDLVGEYEERIAIMQESMEALEKRNEKKETIPISWLKEKLDGHPELPYAVTDGIANVLAIWESEQAVKWE